MEWQRVGHDWETHIHTHTHTRKDALELKAIPYMLLSRSDHVQLTLWIHYCFLLHLRIRFLWVIICGKRFWGKAYSAMGFPGGSVVKNLPVKQEMQVWSGQEDPLGKEMATHSRILAWKSPWTEESGGLESTGWQRVGHDWVTKQQQWFSGRQILKGKTSCMAHSLIHSFNKCLLWALGWSWGCNCE